MPDLSIAYNDIIAACNDPNIGYDSGNKRSTIKLNVNYATYCDCSSLMSWGMTRAGYFKSNPWFGTVDQRDKMLEAGWIEYGLTEVPWAPGDILWKRWPNHGHTEMVYKTSGDYAAYTMGAHTSGTAWARQVSINSYVTTAAGWPGDAPRYALFRAPDSSAAIAHWKQGPGNQYISTADTYTNAVAAYYYFTSVGGYTDAAIAGMLGNFDVESGIDPNLWEGLTIGTGGYGIAQWTPASKYRNWATSEGIDMTDPDENGPGQCRWIDEQTVPTGQWQQKAAFNNMTWAEYKELTDPDYASRAFGRCWEGYGTQTEEQRAQRSVYWYNEIQTNFPYYQDPGGSPSTSRFYPWLYGAMHYRRWTKLMP